MTTAPRADREILFFSGGTALSAAARELARLGVPAAYLVTSFDSGGSSGTLRKALGIPAVGDLRARLTALALGPDGRDTPLRGFLSYRLGHRQDHHLGNEAEAALSAELERLASGEHDLMLALDDKERAEAVRLLKIAVAALPEDFDLAGTSIGNLVLAGAWLENGRSLSRAVDAVCSLAGARGRVAPVSELSVHLAVRLKNGRVLAGQHAFTGKSGGGPDAAIEELWFTNALEDPHPTAVAIEPLAAGLISRAGLICYPVGSFYSSVVAGLMPTGTGRAVAANPCPKVFVPNLGRDPELIGCTVQDQVERLLDVLGSDAPGAGPGAVLNAVLVDPNGDYSGGLPGEWLREKGIEVVEARLVTDQSAPLADGRLLAEGLAGLLKRQQSM